MIEAHVDKRLHQRKRSVKSTTSTDAAPRCARARTAGRFIDFSRAFGPYVLFLVYCVCGGLLFYFIEANMTPVYDNRAKDRNKCIGGHDFWAAFFYVISACSTIGFGTIYACTLPTRILSVLYSIIGIPLVLVILADIGKRMCRLIRFVYIPLYKRFQRARHKKNSMSEVNDNSLVLKSLMTSAQMGMAPGAGGPDDLTSVDSAEEMPDIPVSLGIFLTLSCVFLCALYYNKVENYRVGESIYYSFLTFVAGDFNTNKFKYAVPVYSLIFLGFSMLSLTISIIQNNIDNLINRVKREVRREIRKQQIMIESGIVPPVAEGEEGKSPDEIINDILKKHGATWLVNMIPQSQIQNIQTEVKDVINVNHVEIQTDAFVPSEPIAYVDAAVNSDPIETRSVRTSTAPQTLADVEVDATVPTGARHSQTPQRVFLEGVVQTVPKLRRDGQMQTLPKLSASNEVQARPDQKHVASNSDKPRRANRGVTAAPHTRTILMQFPKAHR